MWSRLYGAVLKREMPCVEIISGVHSLDNCYRLVPDANIVCNKIRLPHKDLWHQKLGHDSYKDLWIVS